jgi:hypothetical protein
MGERQTVVAKDTAQISSKETSNNKPMNKPIAKLRKAPQPPLSHLGATADSDRAKRPPLAEPSATGEELSPGHRVEGLGNFGIPTGELGIVEQTNEEDAVVKWDDDGRKRLHQPCLKKVPGSEHRPVQKNVQFSHRKMFII